MNFKIILQDEIDRQTAIDFLHRKGIRHINKKPLKQVPYKDLVLALTKIPQKI